MMNSYKRMWGAGNQDGIYMLLDRVVEKVKQICGDDAVIRESKDRIRISWDNLSSPFYIQSKPTEFWINGPTVDTDPAIWNLNIESFHQQVIEPIKATIGGVSTGLG